MTEHPRISVLEDVDTGLFALYATSYGSTMPAGPRLFRAPPHPDIAFRHTSQAGAERDAAKLTEYIGRTWQKEVSRKKAREMGAT